MKLTTNSERLLYKIERWFSLERGGWKWVILRPGAGLPYRYVVDPGGVWFRTRAEAEEAAVRRNRELIEERGT